MALPRGRDNCGLLRGVQYMLYGIARHCRNCVVRGEVASPQHTTLVSAARRGPAATTARCGRCVARREQGQSDANEDAALQVPPESSQVVQPSERAGCEQARRRWMRARRASTVGRACVDHEAGHHVQAGAGPSQRRSPGRQDRSTKSGQGGTDTRWSVGRSQE